MKTFMQYLSLLLCFELVMGPVQGSLLLPSEAFALDCPVGQEYNSSVNRCLTKADVIKVNEATEDCGGDKECYKKNATKALNDQGQAGSNDSFFKNDGSGEQKGLVKAGNIVAIAIPALIVTTVLVNRAKAGKDYKCKPASLLLMYAAAASLAVGEIYGYFNHKSKLKKIQEEWDKTVVPKDDSGADKKKSDASEAQSQAFEFLAQNEDQVADTAKTKKGFYLAATGLFAAGAIAAVVEQVQLGIAKTTLKKLPVNPECSAPICATPMDYEQARQKIAKLTCNTDDAVIDPSVPAPAPVAAATTTTPTAATTTVPAATSTDVNSNSGGSYNDFDYDQPNGGMMDDGQRFESPTTVPTKASKFPRFRPHSDLRKMKQVAAYNLSTAKDAEQLLQLVNEMDSIEFENYTKVSYLDEELSRDLKKVTFFAEVSKQIAGAFIPTAQAGDGASKVLTTAATILPLAMGLKSILGGVKFSGGTPLPAGKLNEINKVVSSKLNKAIGKPVTRLAINGVLGGWMGIMSSHMSKQQKLSTERAVALRKMKDEFNSANGLINCKEEDRLDASKPKCFCFTSDNKVNPERSKQAVCANTLAKLKFDPFGQGASSKVCLDQGQNVDTACACRAKKTCMKISSGLNMSGFKPGTFKMISAGSGPAQDLFNGNVGGGDIADSAGINAANIRKAANDMLAKIDPKAAKDKDGFASGLEKGLLASAGGLSMGGGSGSAALPTSPAGAAAALAKELKENKEDEITKSGSASATGADFGSTEEQPEFGMTGDAASDQDIEIAEVMGQELDMGNNDINNGSTTNIFDVLSNRYQRSGMRRLFNEGQGPVDAPDKKELTE